MRSAIGAATRALDNWIEGPASLLSERWSAMRPGGNVAIDIDPNGNALSLETAARTGAARSVVSLAPEQDAEARATVAPLLAERNVTVRVPRSWVFERKVELPLEAATHLDGIVASRISSLSPVPPQDTLFGYRVLSADGASKQLSVAIVILPKARIARTLDLIEGAGWRQVAVEAPFGETDRITLFPPRSGVGGSRRRVKTVVTAVLGLCLASAIVSLAAGPTIDTYFADRRMVLEARANAARAAISNAAAPERAATKPEQAALDIKNDSITSLGALEDLAAALPDHSYATEISLAEGHLRLAGKSSNLPDVLTALESSGRFLDSKLIGTAMRDPDGRSSDFELETRPLIRTGGALK